MNNFNVNIPSQQTNYTPEQMMKLTDKSLINSVKKLISNAELTKEEIKILSSYSIYELANIAITITDEKFKKLGDPYAILNSITALNHWNPTRDTNPFQNYTINMLKIQKRQMEKEKGQSR